MPVLPPIPVGRQDVDWRYDEITGTFNFQEITSEVHTVQMIPEYAGRRGFKLFERPVDNSTLLIYQGSVDADKVTANKQSRVATAPFGSQVYVSPRIALVIVPDTVPIGTSFISHYHGVGSVKNVQNDLYIQQLALYEKLSRSGELPMEGILDMGNHKIKNLLAGINPLDAVNLNQLTQVSNSLAAEAVARANADASLQSAFNSVIKIRGISKQSRNFAGDPSGILGMEAYAPYNGLLLWRNVLTGINGFDAYGDGGSAFQVIDTGSQYEFRWSEPSNALMEWRLIKWS
ncbi:hypothetical protein [Leptospira stimsonii]|uniref:Tail fiber protein n=1 Tax=Leptospira stimsonii TaxID=2202203 RepID=A0ABY2N5M3_9LEPT|nr:hypothetical protein [Leptospira stimsonii]TGK12803.1 hypothetical protein EHO98_19375 [Leptospira stimsonii]TGM17450.1 hypothetical protein EHQ90_07015 [Leptospira stimsonii]